MCSPSLRVQALPDDLTLGVVCSPSLRVQALPDDLTLSVVCSPSLRVQALPDDLTLSVVCSPSLRVQALPDDLTLGVVCSPSLRVQALPDDLTLSVVYFPSSKRSSFQVLLTHFRQFVIPLCSTPLGCSSICCWYTKYIPCGSVNYWQHLFLVVWLPWCCFPGCFGGVFCCPSSSPHCSGPAW